MLRKPAGISWLLFGSSNSLKLVVAGPRKSSGYTSAQLSDSVGEAKPLEFDAGRQTDIEIEALEEFVGHLVFL